MLNILFAFFVLADPISIENFQNGWTLWETRYKMSTESPEYKVMEEDGNQFLHAEPLPTTKGNAAYLKFNIDITKTPLVRWRWRVQSFPKNGDETKRETNDSAAAVYIYFQSGLVRKVIKYVWSASRPVGDWIMPSTSNIFWKMKVKVLESGPPLSKWVEETVDVPADFRAAFGDSPPDTAKGIGVMSDGDATKSIVIADYDDFQALARP